MAHACLLLYSFVFMLLEEKINPSVGWPCFFLSFGLPSLFRIPGRRDVTPDRYYSSHPISQREYGCRCLSEAKERGRLVCQWPISYIGVCHLPYLSFDLLPRSLLSENSQPLNFFFEASNQPDLKLDRVVRERTETFVFKVGQPLLIGGQTIGDRSMLLDVRKTTSLNDQLLFLIIVSPAANALTLDRLLLYVVLPWVV